MKTKKRQNPAYAEDIDSKAWVYAAQALKRGDCYNDMITGARKISDDPIFLKHVDDYRRDISSLSHAKASLMQRRILARLPVRASLKEVPFFLRPHYMKAGWNVTDEVRYLPDKEYNVITKPAAVYHPIALMKSSLHQKRYNLMRKYMKDLIRWPDTINPNESTFTVTKNFDDFYFKIKTAEEGNKLPHIKRHDDIVITARGPREFFDQAFWGLGSHLVVKVLEAYYSEPGVSVLKTFSCDREDLYILDEPNVLKIRYYVRKGSQCGTGLTEEAAFRSMHYFMGKDLVKALGA